MLLKKPQGKQPWVKGGFAPCYMFAASRHILKNTGLRVFYFYFLKANDRGQLAFLHVVCAVGERFMQITCWAGEGCGHEGMAWGSTAWGTLGDITVLSLCSHCLPAGLARLGQHRWSWVAPGWLLLWPECDTGRGCWIWPHVPCWSTCCQCLAQFTRCKEGVGWAHSEMDFAGSLLLFLQEFT